MTFSPPAVVATLNAHRVRYVVIGGIAATLHGSPNVTVDIDITPDPDVDNLGRLAAALKELNARLRVAGEPDGIPATIDATFLGRTQILTLVTDHGDLDISFVPSGTQGYRDLIRDAVVVSLGGAEAIIASLADIIRSKEAAGREKDLLHLPILRRILEETDGRTV